MSTFTDEEVANALAVMVVLWGRRYGVAPEPLDELFAVLRRTSGRPLSAAWPAWAERHGISAEASMVLVELFDLAVSWAADSCDPNEED